MEAQPVYLVVSMPESKVHLANYVELRLCFDLSGG